MLSKDHMGAAGQQDAALTVSSLPVSGKRERCGHSSLSATCATTEGQKERWVKPAGERGVVKAPAVAGSFTRVSTRGSPRQRGGC